MLCLVIIDGLALNDVRKTLELKYNSAKSVLNLFESEGRINRMIRTKKEQRFYKRLGKNPEELWQQQQKVLGLIKENRIIIFQDGNDHLIDEIFIKNRGPVKRTYRKKSKAQPSEGREAEQIGEPSQIEDIISLIFGKQAFENATLPEPKTQRTLSLDTQMTSEEGEEESERLREFFFKAKNP